MASVEITKAVAVTAELTSTTLSPEGARVLLDDLSAYPEAQVLGALQRCRKELRGRLTLADILQRLDDGRPGPEEAWAAMPRSEDETVVWTVEMAQAWGIARPLLEDGDQVAARMAFRESYTKLVSDARERHVAAQWCASLGKAAGREGPLLDAVRRGRLAPEAAVMALIDQYDPETVRARIAAHMQVLIA